MFVIGVIDGAGLKALCDSEPIEWLDLVDDAIRDSETWRKVQVLIWPLKEANLASPTALRAIREIAAHRIVSISQRLCEVRDKEFDGSRQGIAISAPCQIAFARWIALPEGTSDGVN